MGYSLVRIIKAEPISFPEKEIDTRGESKRGEASLIQPVPPLLDKERGIKGVRFINNLEVFITGQIQFGE
jgi:hypothetical protein